MKCQYCNDSYDSPSAKSKFCSTKCRVYYNREQKKKEPKVQPEPPKPPVVATPPPKRIIPKRIKPIIASQYDGYLEEMRSAGSIDELTTTIGFMQSDPLLKQDELNRLIDHIPSVIAQLSNG